MSGIEITLFVGQADVNTISIESEEVPLDFIGAGITKVACVIPDLVTADSDTSAVVFSTGEVKLKLGELIKVNKHRSRYIGRLVEYQGSEDTGRVLLDDILFIVKA